MARYLIRVEDADGTAEVEISTNEAGGRVVVEPADDYGTQRAQAPRQQQPHEQPREQQTPQQPQQPHEQPQRPPARPRAR